MPGVDWTRVKLAIFDVDGTLYKQRPVRLAMAVHLAARCLRSLGTREARLLSRYRKYREEDAFSHETHFHDELLSRLAGEMQTSPDAVQATVDDWMHRRPLRHLKKAARPGIEKLFDELRRRHVAIGILSDYPAAPKLAALGLEADYIVHAEEPDVARQKPDPAGLRKLMRLAGVEPEQTVYFGDRTSRDGVLGVAEQVPTILIGGDQLEGCRSIGSFEEINAEFARS